MKELFNEHFRFLGDLTSPTFSLENIICELDVNHFDTRNMSVKVVPTQGSIFFVIAALKEKENIVIKSKGLNNEIILEVGSPNIRMDSKSGQTATFKVFKYSNTINYSNGVTYDTIKYNVTIPDCILFSRDRSITKHYTKGLLAGWREINKNHSITEEWEEEKYIFKTKYGFMNILPTFLFGELKKNRLGDNAVLTLEQIEIYLKIKSKRHIHFDTEAEVIKTIQDFLRIASFLEGEYFEMKKLVITYKLNGKPVKEKSTLFWNRDIRDNAKVINHYKKFKITYHKILQCLFNSYVNMEVGERNELDKILVRYTTASTQKIIDTQLIYWHSCLDVINKYFKAKGKSFNHKVINCCLKNNIDWSDLFPNLNIVTLEEKQEFLINKVRNEMLHDGIYPDDYEPIFREIRKIKALSERLICKILKVDYKETGVGIVQI
jgi:hypothetical protein